MTVNNDIVRVRIICKGRVQGVGFRYTAWKAADSLGVTGWARNEYDGSVCMEHQGRRDAVASVIPAIERDSYIRIDETESKLIEPIPEERGFRVKY